MWLAARPGLSRMVALSYPSTWPRATGGRRDGTVHKTLNVDHRRTVHRADRRDGVALSDFVRWFNSFARRGLPALGFGVTVLHRADAPVVQHVPARAPPSWPAWDRSRSKGPDLISQTIAAPPLPGQGRRSASPHVAGGRCRDPAARARRPDVQLVARDAPLRARSTRGQGCASSRACSPPTSSPRSDPVPSVTCSPGRSAAMLAVLWACPQFAHHAPFDQLIHFWAAALRRRDPEWRGLVLSMGGRGTTITAFPSSAFHGLKKWEIDRAGSHRRPREGGAAWT